MNTDDLIENFKKGQLEIDCTEIALTQMGSKNPILYKGKGYIRQNDKGIICFKVYCTEITNTDGIAHSHQSSSWQSGTLYGENEHFELSAQTLDNRIWLAKRFTVTVKYPYGGGYPIVTGEISTFLTKWHVKADFNTIKLYFLESVNVPCTAGKFEFCNDNHKFNIQKSESEFVIEVNSNQKFDKYLHIRIQESLRFLLAKTLEWTIKIEQNDTIKQLEFASKNLRSSQTRLNPPLLNNNRLNLINSWELFSRYLEYISKNGQSDMWHPCTCHLYKACEASANSLDAQAIGLCVSVEGILSLVKLDKDLLELEDLNLLIDDVKKFVSERHKPHKERINGLLGSLKTVSASDKLNHLKNGGYISLENIKAWKKIRPKHIHPDETNPRNFEPDHIQWLVDDIGKVVTLMYQIVFVLIGYKGKFTDYGTHDWPIKDFPVKPFLIASSTTLNGSKSDKGASTSATAP